MQKDTNGNSDCNIAEVQSYFLQQMDARTNKTIVDLTEDIRVYSMENEEHKETLNKIISGSCFSTPERENWEGIIKAIDELLDRKRLALSTAWEQWFHEQKAYTLPPDDPQEQGQEETFFYESRGKFYDSKENVPVGQTCYARPCLVGGIRPGGYKGKYYKNQKKRNGNRKPNNRPKTLLDDQGIQLGQINRYVPMDRPSITTLRYNNVLTTDGSGNLIAQFSTRNPLTAFNGSGNYVNAVDYGALYDQYKVKRWVIQYEPSPGGPVKGGIVIAHDRDAAATDPVPNYANVINYGGYHIYNAGLQFEHKAKIRTIYSATNSATDPPTAIQVHDGGFIDSATPGVPGKIYVLGIGLGNSITLGTFVLTLDVVWRFRR